LRVRSEPSTLASKLSWAGYAAAIIYWAFTSASIYLNPWFSLYTHALSDLAGPRANAPWVYNLGLVLSGLAAFLYALAIILGSGGRLEVVGGAYWSIAALFLALIGVFPAGTRPHVFVSTYFFFQAFLAILILALAHIKRRKRVAYTLASLYLLGLLGLALPWPSVALAETYLIGLLMASVLTYNLGYLARRHQQACSR